ncbi:MAG: imidazole glycerol phosphate synthase subunit HisH [Planctomycetota bacterium]
MITVVDYKAGNLTSVRLAFEHLGSEVAITDRPEPIRAAERVVFPGVGAAQASMDTLRRLGLLEPLREVVRRGTPFLGICIGMQLLFERSEEDGGTETIGVLPGEVRRFRPSDPMCKIPQMGWNRVRLRRAHPLLAGIEDETEFYFVHSYYPAPSDDRVVVGETDYADVVFASIAARANVFATQFHPERSGRIGLRMLDSFTRWDGEA